MRQRTIWLSSVAAGAATAFVLDPTRGKRRRHRIADAATHLVNETGEAIFAVGRDYRNRLRGLLATARSAIGSQQPSDSVLAQRVRSALGRVAARPHALRVEAHDGHLVLRGTILEAEEPRVVDAARSVSGVKDVEARFETHEEAGNIPSLQGGPPRRPMRRRLDLWQTNWTPATRALVGASGAGLVAAGFTRRDTAGAGLAFGGVALLARAITNLEFARLLGIGAGRRAHDAAMVSQ